ncbi:MAG TPA: translocation/assembly module TamB domain-containing protein [Candidatus Limnocylindrales bacterium]|nr:translocation/assembly module TamB domain-containing protein [Candidatus Limnocylindrales bacterium]
MTWKRALIAVTALLVGVTATLLLVVQSAWFYGKVRDRIVTEVERATGGRVEAQSFTFDWHTFRAELRGFVLHGTEPAGKPPLLRTESVAVGMKIVSLLKRDFDVQYIDVSKPQLYLIINADGSTNVPKPKIPGHSNTMQKVMQLAIGRFRAWNGVVDIEAREHLPFTIDGRNVAATVFFDGRGPRYQGNVSINPLNLNDVPVDFNATVALEQNRISIASANLKTGNSTMTLSGALENLVQPRASFRYNARIAVDDAAHTLKTKLPARGGVAQSSGTVTWAGKSDFSLSGKWLVPKTTVEQIGTTRAEGDVSASPKGIQLSSVRVWAARPTAFDARIARVDINGRNLDLHGLRADGLGGSFAGEARVRNLDRFTATGDVTGIDARRAVALYSTEVLPWNAAVSGKVDVEGSLSRRNDWRATVALRAEGAQVHGEIAATYDARSSAVDISRGSLTLPSSRAEIAGAPGKDIRLHLETRDLADLLPILGQSAASLPLKIRNGSITFDGTATGQLNDLRAAGRVSATDFTIEGRDFDSLTGNLTASAANAQLTDAVLKRGGMQAQFRLAVNLNNWKPEDNSLIDGSGSVRNASAPELIALAGLPAQPLTGAVSATARINGTVANPLITADVSAVKGSFRNETFDQATAQIIATKATVQVRNAVVTAGGKQLHASGTYDRGRLSFDLRSNSMPLDEIATVKDLHPGIKGTLQLTAKGAVHVDPFRIEALQAEVNARGLQLANQPLGDAHADVTSGSGTLHARLDSNFAGSAIQGTGEWKLEGNYPGSATITFAKLDFAALRDWLYPSLAGTPALFSGSAEGQLYVDAPLLNPAAGRGELRIPQLQISATSEAASLTLKNSGPIVAMIANSVVTIASARLVGHDTDLAISGKAALTAKQALDLRVNGHVDLALVHELNRDFTASGELVADAGIHGTLDAPQLTGRVSFQNASFYVADLPNGITGANGVIGFAANRATIQSFTGETGGGKVTLSGFAGFGNGPIIFRLHARLDQVRVRYPEGVSTVADANLNLTGTTDRSMLSGTISVIRMGFNPQADLSSIVAQSAQPVHTPSVRAGFLGGLNFDVQIQTAPDIQFESSLTQDVQMEANLRLRGTATNPALQGRVNVTEGVVTFFGTKYHISQGSISFYNQLRIDPVLDIDLDTKARGIDITLTVSGPLNKLTLTPRSDPPLQFNEIVALLATGRTPTNDPTLLNQQATSPQSWQQMGASALLGQAIASPVAGRLQRFFGVSNLRIDPTLPGVEYNPQARLTLEQQITPEITFTYITNVTSSNPEVVRVEWAFAKTWSVVALREENGMFGVDFFYKRRF